MLPWAVLALFLSAASAADVTRAEIERKILSDIYLQSKFHSYVRPHRNEADEPVQVNVNLYVLELRLDEENQEMAVTMYFRQEWNDSRLAYDNQGKINDITLHDVIGFWTPDLFFVDERNAHLHTVTKPNTFAKIYPDGRVLHSQKLSLRSSCPLNLKRYPFDSQTCRVRIESYGYTADDLLLFWRPGKEPPVSGQFRVAGFDSSFTHSEEVSVVSIGNRYTAAILEVNFRRHATSYFVQIYVPVSLFVVASWITFWLSPESHVTRLGLSFAMAASALLHMNLNSGLFLSPGYLTGLDVWVAFSSAMLNTAFWENVYVTYANRRSGEGRNKTKDSLASLAVRLSANVDAISRALFPALFLLFHVFFLV